MGVHYLIRNLENINGRLPFRLTFNNDEMESDPNIQDYKQIGFGLLQYIGIDGSVIIHSKIIADKNNNNQVYIEKSVIEIVETILRYIKSIIIFFNIFNNDNDKNEKQNVILHFVIDGKPPCKKNRKKIIDDEGNETYKLDAYSLMSLEEKRRFHKNIIKVLKEKIMLFNNDDNDNDSQLKNYNITLLTNYNVSEDERGEGEIELYKFCQLLNKKRQNNNNNNNNNNQYYKNVIISSDSDLISLMLMHQDSNLVIISPLNKIYITNFNLLTKALNLTGEHDVIKFVLLHFIFFGSDYNLGLMTNPNDNKQKVILEGIRNNVNNINEIGQNCKRKRKRNNNDDKFLENLKNLLIYEAICAFMYYFDINNGAKYLLNYSPRLYEISVAKSYIPSINFQ